MIFLGILIGVIVGFGLAMLVAHINGLNAKPYEQPTKVFKFEVSDGVNVLDNGSDLFHGGTIVERKKSRFGQPKYLVASKYRIIFGGSWHNRAVWYAEKNVFPPLS